MNMIYSNFDLDQSGYTQGDLVAAICKWQLDADYIALIAEDLPEGALEETCRALYGAADGEDFAGMIAEVYYSEPTDTDLWDRGMSAALGNKPSHN